MAETYSAILKGDRLEWTGAPPGPEVQGRAVAVQVSIVRDIPADLAAVADRRRRMVAALDRLAARGAFTDIEDPVAWQREARQDRPLPGRKP